ncbi:MAG: hypothetical protein LBJ23_11155 [Tannerella sp.]|nr:hypothetical protein [Tannerella sp.]
MINGPSQRDVFSLKGKPALGTEFYTPFQELTGGDYYGQGSGGSYDKAGDQIDIVATENATTVTIYPTRNYIGQSTDVYTLDKGETLKLMEPLTPPAERNSRSFAGTRITSTKPIAVTITEDCIKNAGAVDVLGDQIVPVDMLGTRYVVIAGYANTSGAGGGLSPTINPVYGERIDFVSTTDGPNNVTVSWKGSSTSHPFNGPGETWHYNIPIGPSGVTADTAVFVQADSAIYCFQRSAVASEMGAAILPSMYSISQHRIDFFQTSGTSYIFVVFKEGTDDQFEFYANGTDITSTITVTPQSIPFPSEISSKDWKFARINLGATERMITVINDASAFSLGYFNQDGGTAAYGYLSGFGSMSLPFDTLWICGGSQVASGSCIGDIQLQTGVLIADKWKWSIDEAPLPESANDTLIIADKPGMYSVIVDQDGYEMRDTCWVLQMTFDATFDLRQPAKPAKVTVPQIFTVRYGAAKRLPGAMSHQWHVDGGTVVSWDENHLNVIWHTTGRKQVRLELHATGPGCLGGSPDRTCDTVLVYDVLVHEKNLGFFVDQNVPYGREHDGTSWDSAFPTIQQALALASQGDYIWVADGHYSPRDSFPSNTDSANVYTGYYMLDYDSLRIFTPSYVMDWDSVQVFGGFSGYGEGYETNLSERDINAWPVVLHGSDDANPVIKIDGSTVYTHLGGTSGVSRAARWDGVTVRDGQAAYGAGILFENGASGTISNTVVKANHASIAGGGIYIAQATTGEPPLLLGVEISGNTAEDGAGIYNSGSNLQIVNATVSGNLASARGGGLYNAGGDAYIYNSIIYDNRASGSADRADVQVMGGTPTYRSSDIGGSKPNNTWSAAFGTDGGGNIDANPGFIVPGFDEKGAMTEGNYLLRSINRKVVEGGASNLWIPYPASIALSSPSPGHITYIGFLNRDLAGNNRIIYDYIDMGAYEFIGTTVIPDVTYRVEVPALEGAGTIPPAGVYYVLAHANFSVSLVPREDYTIADAQVKTGSVWQDELGRMVLTDNADGTKTYTFHDIVDPLKIQVTGVTPAGNADIEGATLIWAEAKQLHIQTPAEGVLHVYTLTGRLYTQQKVSAGRTSFALPAGMYIVTLDGYRKQRVVIP